MRKPPSALSKQTAVVGFLDYSVTDHSGQKVFVVLLATGAKIETLNSAT